MAVLALFILGSPAVYAVPNSINYRLDSWTQSQGGGQVGLSSSNYRLLASQAQEVANGAPAAGSPSLGSGWIHTLGEPDTLPPGAPVLTAFGLGGGAIEGTSDEPLGVVEIRVDGGQPLAGSAVFTGTGFSFPEADSPLKDLTRGHTVDLLVRDRAGNPSRPVRYLSRAISQNVFEDIQVYRGSSGRSQRFVDHAFHAFKIAAKPGQRVTVRLWVRPDPAEPLEPAIVLAAPGETPAAKVLDATTGNPVVDGAGWGLWKVSLDLASGTSGVVLTLSITTPVGSVGAFNVDDISVEQP